jgi:hypothetical protein
MIIPSVRWREFVAIDLTRRDDCISPRTRRSGLPTTNRGRAINLPFGRGSRVHGRVTHCLPYIRVPKRVGLRTVELCKAASTACPVVGVTAKGR